MPEGAVLRVFISYGQARLDWASHLKNMLRGPRIDVFVAEGDLPAGQGLSSRIASQIKASDLVILLWDSAAAQSKYVAKEVFLAKTEGKSIIPVMLEEGTPLPVELGDIKYLSDPIGQIPWLVAEVHRRANEKRTANHLALALAGFMAWALLSGD